MSSFIRPIGYRLVNQSDRNGPEVVLATRILESWLLKPLVAKHLIRNSAMSSVSKYLLILSLILLALGSRTVFAASVVGVSSSYDFKFNARVSLGHDIDVPVYMDETSKVDDHKIFKIFVIPPVLIDWDGFQAKYERLCPASEQEKKVDFKYPYSLISKTLIQQVNEQSNAWLSDLFENANAVYPGHTHQNISNIPYYQYTLYAGRYFKSAGIIVDQFPPEPSGVSLQSLPSNPMLYFEQIACVDLKEIIDHREISGEIAINNKNYEVDTVAFSVAQFLNSDVVNDLTREEKQIGRISSSSDSSFGGIAINLGGGSGLSLGGGENHQTLDDSRQRLVNSVALSKALRDFTSSASYTATIESDAAFHFNSLMTMVKDVLPSQQLTYMLGDDGSLTFTNGEASHVLSSDEVKAVLKNQRDIDIGVKDDQSFSVGPPATNKKRPKQPGLSASRERSVETKTNDEAELDLETNVPKSITLYTVEKGEIRKAINGLITIRRLKNVKGEVLPMPTPRTYMVSVEEDAQTKKIKELEDQNRQLDQTVKNLLKRL
ncbi:hypothetical protein Q7C_2615 [Methylophaga frappieri]|uniref:Uncharacterized protein n=1 Tax=Methylophaga frappieri (strain ATCC BAA-2434 / DSM 25690 / JAM7) TaxID=754477 RepID=I1YLE3_METFJ|nr:hypothetical protein [Methylophaga frappieri]AFJ03736.1 hypothetical protein Q7C_2615 [Methylophaga frappieri]